MSKQSGLENHFCTAQYANSVEAGFTTQSYICPGTILPKPDKPFTPFLGFPTSCVHTSAPLSVKRRFGMVGVIAAKEHGYRVGVRDLLAPQFCGNGKVGARDRCNPPTCWLKARPRARLPLTPVRSTHNLHGPMEYHTFQHAPCCVKQFQIR